jgi:hypothetical protein
MMAKKLPSVDAVSGMLNNLDVFKNDPSQDIDIEAIISLGLMGIGGGQTRRIHRQIGRQHPNQQQVFRVSCHVDSNRTVDTLRLLSASAMKEYILMKTNVHKFRLGYAGFHINVCCVLATE